MNTGEFRFETVKPGAVPYPDGQMQAPHITAWIVARGINIGLHTRIYFEDEGDANTADPILSRIAHPNRIATLLAKKEADGHYRFDIHLQGPDETIFFDI
jgi:protocatechuate 3,4-dioxygenase alpha subunit